MPHSTFNIYQFLQYLTTIFPRALTPIPPKRDGQNHLHKRKILQHIFCTSYHHHHKCSSGSGEINHTNRDLDVVRIPAKWRW
eukprot:scaffold22981_cov80-Skeletonema_menzelii.AAC.1